MPHLTNEDLATGILDVMSGKDRDTVKKQLIDLGQEVALNKVCSIISTRTGLSSDACRVVGKVLIKKVKQSIRKRMS